MKQIIDALLLLIFFSFQSCSKNDGLACINGNSGHLPVQGVIDATCIVEFSTRGTIATELKKEGDDNSNWTKVNRKDAGIAKFSVIDEIDNAPGIGRLLEDLVNREVIFTGDVVVFDDYDPEGIQ